MDKDKIICAVDGVEELHLRNYKGNEWEWQFPLISGENSWTKGARKVYADFPHEEWEFMGVSIPWNNSPIPKGFDKLPHNLYSKSWEEDPHKRIWTRIFYNHPVRDRF